MELHIRQEGRSRVVMQTRCPAGNHHRECLRKLAVFEEVLRQVSTEQWQGCTASVSCLAPSKVVSELVPSMLLTQVLHARMRWETHMYMSDANHLHEERHRVPLAFLLEEPQDPTPLVAEVAELVRGLQL